MLDDPVLDMHVAQMPPLWGVPWLAMVHAPVLAHAHAHALMSPFWGVPWPAMMHAPVLSHIQPRAHTCAVAPARTFACRRGDAAQARQVGGAA